MTDRELAVELEHLRLAAAAAEVESLRAENAKLEAIAKAAATFVDEPGGLARGDFAADLFDDLARALEAAGR